MAVQKMKMAYLSGSFNTLNDLTKCLINCNYFQPENTCDVLGTASGFLPITEDNPYAITLNRLKNIIDEYGFKPKLGKAPKKIIEDETAKSMLENIETQLKKLQDDKQELSSAYDETGEVIEHLQNFSSLNVDLNKMVNLSFVKPHFGRIPTASIYKLNYYVDNPYVDFYPASSNDEYSWGLYFSPREHGADVERIFASLFFESIELPSQNGTPAEIIAEMRDTLLKIEEKLKTVETELHSFITSHEKEIYKLYNQIKRQKTAFDLRRYAAQYDESYLLIGWIPADRVEKFKKIIDSECVGTVVEFSEPDKNSALSPPTKLKNSFLFRPFQYFVEIYGAPKYGEVDPTVFVAITYTLLYGIMFADLGQGIILSLAGFFMYKFMNMPLGKILIPCGVCGAFFGTVFGSFFGYEDALNPLYTALGFSEKPFDVMNNATELLAVSIGIGVLLVILAMFLNIYSCLKKKEYGEMIFGHNGICGVVLYSSILLVGLSVAGFLSVPVLPFSIIGIVLPLLLIFFKIPLSNLINGKGFKTGESISDFILENFFELFEVILSYLTNTLSFLRVGAFVLIHAGMMTAFFALAEIMGSGIPYVIMVIFGNVFVIALEGLLVGIQVLRLEFYEMFSRFYEGSGKIFTASSIQNS